MHILTTAAEELSMELESKNVEFGYFNYVEGDVKIIADARAD